MRIRNISKKSSGKLHVAYAIASGEDWEERSIASPDEPREELDVVLDELKSFVLKACRVAPKEIDNLVVTGATFSYQGEETCKVTVRGKLKVDDANSPVLLNTPLRTLWSSGETESIDQVDAKARQSLDKLLREGELYINGTRRQMELPTAKTEAA